MKIKLSLEDKHNCMFDCDKNEFVFKKTGGEVFYKLNEKVADESKYFAFEIENPQDFSVRIEIHFYKSLQRFVDGEDGLSELKPDFSITTGILPFIKTTVEIPLSYLDGQQLFGDRKKGVLKTVVNGRRMALPDIAYVGIYMARCHIEPKLSISNVRFTAEQAPQSEFSFDSLIDEFGQWNKKDWKGKTKSLAELKEYLDGEIEKAEEFLKDYQDGYYGQGDADYDATGYFRVQKTEDNRFVMITPDGKEFFGFGCDCVGVNITGPMDDGKMHNFLEDNLRKVYGDLYYDKWSVLTKYRLIKWGINTIGTWSDMNFAKKSKIPYVAILNRYPSTKKCIYRDFPDVFSDEFKENSKIYATALEEYKGDPYLIGYFMSNEPNWAFVWGLNLGYELFISPRTVKSKAKLVKWLIEIYNDIDSLNKSFRTNFKDFDDILDADINTKISRQAVKTLDIFSKLLINEYIKVPALTLKETDKDHLNLGIRYAFISNDDLFEGKEYLDVFSINCYDNYCDKSVRRVFEKTDMPVMVGEFHFGALDAGLPATGIRGVASQKERGKAICAYADNAKHIGCCVGVHYFQLNDQPYLGRSDGENYNIGLVDICCKEYTDATNIISPINRIPEIFF
ncbi:MAG: beta-galactosidase [Oscillospiraceae bacterium]|nr:beta-galactosidase [Oscillospiraceae bacterium]